MRSQHSPLNPQAFAIAGGVGAVALALLFGFGMMGAGSMMGGGWMGGHGGYGSYQSHWSAGSSLVMLMTVLFGGLVTGWITASVYNSVLSQREESTKSPSDRPGDTTGLRRQP